MNIRICGAALLLATLAAGCAATTDTQSVDAVMAAENTADATVAMADRAEAGSGDPDEMVCKVEKQTGSRIRRKVCATREQWERTEEYAQEATEKMQRGPQKLEEQ
ncbi:MAG: hypothetical protein P8172_07625 [Gammaproteobacteria bacterium]|jgi:hypothetical protein